MIDQNSQLPAPHARLWSTLFRWPRNVRRFAPRIDLDEVVAGLPDPAEAAHWGEVMLLEDLLVALHRDGTTTHLTHIITAPHADSRLAEWDEVSHVYEAGVERPTVHLARVRLPDGSFRGAQRMDVPVSRTERCLKHVFAPLRPGVLVEFEQQVDYFKPEEVGPVMYSQFLLESLHPCRRRRITVAVAEPFAARIELHHSDRRPQTTREGEYTVHRWDLADVPGIEADVWTPPPRDFAPWVDISTLPSWMPVVRHYRKELLPQGPMPSSIGELARKLAASAPNAREKALAVYRWATRDVRYGRHPSELAVNTIREAGKVLEDLRGDCKDKSALMVMLLGEMKIPAKVAVLLTAQNGRTPMLPSRRFDHAIVRAQVDGEELWFDPASGPYSFGTIPQNDQGVKALIIDSEEGEPRFVDVPEGDLESQKVERLCQGEMDGEGTYAFHARATTRGERAAMYRAHLMDRNDEHRRLAVQQSVSEERPGADVDEIDIGDVEDLRGDVHLGYRVTLRRWARRVADLLLFRIPWAEPLDFVGPISAPHRYQPLQLPPPLRLIEEHAITIPEGYSGYGLPRKERHDCPWARYTLTMTSEGNRLVCRRELDNHGGIVSTEAFPELRAFWEACARADQSDVVLKGTEE
jgi:hypothetical protein